MGSFGRDSAALAVKKPTGGLCSVAFDESKGGVLVEARRSALCTVRADGPTSAGLLPRVPGGAAGAEGIRFGAICVGLGDALWAGGTAVLASVLMGCGHPFVEAAEGV